MLAIPEITRVDMAFGNIKHMPKFETLPEPFKDWFYNPYCNDVGSWFYKGAEGIPNGIKLNGTVYTAKPGVEAGKALAAIKAVLGSFEPKHEHKIAACGYMLSEWFDKSEG
jgi:hypothetical protein